MQSTAGPSTSGACPVAPSSSFSSFPCHAASVSCRAVAGAGASAAPLRIRRQLPSLPLFSHRRTTAAAVAAAEVPGERQEGADIAGRLHLGAMIVVWYLLNIYFNIYNKQVLKALPFPYTITAFQLASGSLFILLMWATNLHPAPKVSLAQLATILPLAIAHTLGTVFTNMSLGKVAVSFTHTVKAMEPFFTVLLSVVFLGERPSPMVMTSLVPIVGGVALASLTEVSFNWVGFWSAMASNLTNQSRNVLSKNHIGDKEEALDNINLFSIITVMSFVLSTPLMLFAEGIMFTPPYLQSTGTNIRELCVGAALAGFCFHGYQQVSYMILARVSPVTHSVANCVKRVVIIVSSIIFFRTPISPVNALGTGVALGGVFLYSRLKKTKPKLA